MTGLTIDHVISGLTRGLKILVDFVYPKPLQHVPFSKNRPSGAAFCVNRLDEEET